MKFITKVSNYNTDIDLLGPFPVNLWIAGLCSFEMLGLILDCLGSEGFNSLF